MTFATESQNSQFIISSLLTEDIQTMMEVDESMDLKQIEPKTYERPSNEKYVSLIFLLMREDYGYVTFAEIFKNLMQT